MKTLTIRNLPEQAKHDLRVQAAQAGLSLEAHVRGILQRASAEAFQPQADILRIADKHFGPRRGVDLELPGRGSKRESVRFE